MQDIYLALIFIVTILVVTYFIRFENFIKRFFERLSQRFP